MTISRNEGSFIEPERINLSELYELERLAVCHQISRSDPSVEFSTLFLTGSLIDIERREWQHRAVVSPHHVQQSRAGRGVPIR